jgi:hypothetical protein
MPPRSIRQGVQEPRSSRIAPTGSLRLDFAPEIRPVVRARIGYACRVFASIYGYRVLEESESSRDALVLYYGPSPARTASSDTVRLPARYRLGESETPRRPLIKHEYADETFWLFFGVDRSTERPDWLGEIFEWLSSSIEHNVTERDPVGRIPFSKTILAEEGRSPRKPYAMLLMSWLQNELTTRGQAQSLPKAPSPVPEADHFIVCSHDIDFYYTSKRSTLARLLKNLVISVRPYRDASFFAWNFREVFGLLVGKRTADYLGPLLCSAREHDFSSTIFAVSTRSHRRDPNYRIADLAQQLRLCAGDRFSIALHGSYESIIGKTGLAGEVAAMTDAVLIRPLGGRQHWLRFSEHQSLFNEVQKAGLHYDSTLGYAETAGFRNGACFAFPPYDFGNERPYPFLEIPLVLMDGNVEAAARSSGKHPAAIVREILSESRKLGWGGVSIDWHNPLEAIQVPPKINKVFWDSLAARERYRERWISADEFLGLTLSRYQNAGLLRNISPAPERPRLS